MASLRSEAETCWNSEADFQVAKILGLNKMEQRFPGKVSGLGEEPTSIITRPNLNLPIVVQLSVVQQVNFYSSWKHLTSCCKQVRSRESWLSNGKWKVKDKFWRNCGKWANTSLENTFLPDLVSPKLSLFSNNNFLTRI